MQHILVGLFANFIFLWWAQANEICKSLTLLVLPLPELRKQFLKKKQQTSNCMTHPLKRESKSLCVNNCIINNPCFLKIVDILGQTSLWYNSSDLSEFTWDQKSSSLLRDRGDSVHAFVSQFGKLVAALCLCMSVLHIIQARANAHVHPCMH